MTGVSNDTDIFNFEIESEIDDMKEDIRMYQKARDKKIKLSQELKEGKIEQEKITRRLKLLSEMEESNEKLKDKKLEENELKKTEENLISGIKGYRISKEKRRLATELKSRNLVEDKLGGLFSLVSEKIKIEKIFFINKSNR